MTRAEARKNLVLIGIESPSEEQISNYLDQVNGENESIRSRAERYKEESKRATELQKQLDEIEKQNLTELERMTKRAEEAEALANARQLELTTSKIESIFAKGGLTGDVYASAIKAFSAMSVDDAISTAEAFVSGISETKKAELETAKTEWEKEKLLNTPNPDLSDPNNRKEEPEEKPSIAAEYAKKYSTDHAPKAADPSF